MILHCNPLFPLLKSLAFHLNNFESSSPNNALWQVSFNWPSDFEKMKKFTMTTDNREISVFGPRELKKINIRMSSLPITVTNFLKNV